MSGTIPPPLSSPGTRIRRGKGGKELPRLPLSAFSPPNSGTSDSFPLPPDPSSVHPEQVIDAHVGDLAAWRAQAGEALGAKVKGVVLTLKSRPDGEIEGALEQLSSETDSIRILSAIVPLPVTDATFVPPSYLTGSPSTPRTAVSLTFTSPSTPLKEALSWTMSHGLTATIDVASDLAAEGAWEGLEELIASADAPSMTPVEGPPSGAKGKIVLSNVLPPADELSLPIVKLLTHPVYLNYQTRIAALSLYSHVYINFLPPAWGRPVPSPAEESKKELNEWKRRLKMYIGPVIEAFGFQRVIFGSTPAASQEVPSNAGDWYVLARECFAELGIEQEGVDAVFWGNAKNVYA